MSVFTERELAYLHGAGATGPRLARVATVGADGTPHVVPVGWSYLPAEDAIQVGGAHLARTKKFRDVRRTGRAAVVIDDLASVRPWRPRGIEVRGPAEVRTTPREVIRLYPERVVSWGIESDEAGRRLARSVRPVSAHGLAYDERGQGPAIVLVHGHPFDRRMWRPQLATLSERFRVVAPDLPGLGDSRPGDEPVTMRSFADAIAGLSAELGLRRPVVAGLSMGGLVAMELALARPGEISGVALCATTAQPVTAEEAQQRRARAAEIEAEGMLGTALEMAGRLFGPAARRDADLVEFVMGMMLHAPPAGAAAALRARAERPDYAARLPGLAVPSLVIAGDGDPYAPEPVVEQLAGALPSPRVVRLPGVGHLPNLEAPDAFAAALAEFADEVAHSGA